MSETRLYREVNAILQRKAVARDRAKAAGRKCVASCRQSDVETCYEILRLIKEVAQPIPSGGERQCPTCGSPSEGFRKRRGEDRKWHVQCAECSILPCERCSDPWHDQLIPLPTVPDLPYKVDEPVSAEATKPRHTTAEEDRHYICEIGRLFWGDDKECYAASAVYRKVKSIVAPPVAPEAEGAREWLEFQRFEPVTDKDQWPEDTIPLFVSTKLAEFVSLPVLMERYVTFKLAHKEAEISRLTAERDRVRNIAKAGWPLIEKMAMCPHVNHELLAKDEMGLNPAEVHCLDCGLVFTTSKILHALTHQAFVIAGNMAWKEVETVRSANTELRTALNEALNYQVSNRGTEDAFYNCVTSGKNLPKWVVKAERLAKGE